MRKHIHEHASPDGQRNRQGDRQAGVARPSGRVRVRINRSVHARACSCEATRTNGWLTFNARGQFDPFLRLLLGLNALERLVNHELVGIIGEDVPGKNGTCRMPSSPKGLVVMEALIRHEAYRR